MRRATLFLFITPFLAGCLADVPMDPAPDEPSPERTPIDGRWWLDRDMGLRSEPDIGEVPIAWSWGEWLAGTEPPTWQAAIADTDVVLLTVNVTLTYQAPAPGLVSTQNRPQFTMWFGAGDSIIEHGFQPGPELFQGQETVTFDVDSLPLGGLVVEYGTPLTLRVGTYYPDSGAVGSVDLVLEGSYLDIQGHTVGLPASGIPERIVSETATLLGGRCVADLNPESIAMAYGRFEVTPSTTRVDASITPLDGAGGIDQDFFLMDANDTIVAYASGPASPENLHLRAPNLEGAAPGFWTWGVYNCQPQARSVWITVETA